MTITRKPRPKNPVDVEALIAKGGRVPGETSERTAPQALTLRLDPQMLRLIEQARSRRPFRISRHSWILEAVAEKLARDKDR